MKKIKDILEGKKTYILTALGCIYVFLIALGIAPNSEVVWGLLGGGTLASLRDALNHVQPAQGNERD